MNSIISSNLVSSASNVASSASVISSAVSASVSSASKLQKVAIGCGVIGAIAIVSVVGFNVIKSIKTKKAETQADHDEVIKITAEGDAPMADLDAQAAQIDENIVEAEGDLEEIASKEEAIEKKIEAVTNTSDESIPVVGKYGVLVENEDAFCKLADAMETADLILDTDADKYAAARRQLDSLRAARSHTNAIFKNADLDKYAFIDTEAEEIRISLISIETFLPNDKRIGLNQDAELPEKNYGIIDVEAAAADLKARQEAIARELETEFEEELAAEGEASDGTEFPETKTEAKDEPQAITEEAKPEEPQYVTPRNADTPWTTIGTMENVKLIDAVKKHLREKIIVPEVEVHDYPEFSDDDEEAKKKAREVKAATEIVHATVRMLTELRLNLFSGEETLDDNNRKFIHTCMNRIYRASGYDPTSLIAKVLNLTREIPDWCNEKGCSYYTEFEEVVCAWEPKSKNCVDVKVHVQLKPVVVESAFRQDRMLLRGILKSVIDVQIAKLNLGTTKA